MVCCAVVQADHDDVIKWKPFPRYWPFVRGIHRSPVNSLHKGQDAELWCFSFICAWINGWVNNRKAGDLRRYRAHYDVIVICQWSCREWYGWINHINPIWIDNTCIAILKQNMTKQHKYFNSVYLVSAKRTKTSLCTNLIKRWNNKWQFDNKCVSFVRTYLLVYQRGSR